ncbi:MULTISPECIES: RNA polymerase sigma factor RpoH [unclassified Thalassospira]|jgi:RNA polymerase sigma-32 factor|uniref:RNA polymerase sigma factor RpoH n=1 Tax=unclassified Thalassospira TaxID=2648997 RepID=UPI000A1EF84E|nr:RNA polymerase sigma factor RpoH [Thalassospira sp. MCCC 1A01428]OSQ42867.1 RNA polymerase sigma 70 [Thalassospira sp. MCCC 1A01428]
MKQGNAVPTISPDGLTGYLQRIRRYPMLAPDIETALAERYRDHQDEKAAEKLITSHLRLVAKIAMSYRGYGLPINELISEGNIGLLQSVKRFDPDKGFRIATYAMWWIRAAIQEYILHSWSLVKIGTTASQKKLFFNLRKLKSQMQAIDEGDMTPEQVETIAEKLNVSEDDVIMMNRRLAGPDHSLNAPVRVEGEGEWVDWLECEDDNQEVRLGRREEFVERMNLLKTAMSGLNDRERDILTQRRLCETPVTLENLSMTYGISRERIRQIEVRAFEKICQTMHN